MNKHVWTFPYTAAVLLGAANEKVEYHAARSVWWENKRKESLAKLKETGIEISESIVEREAKLGYSNTRIGGRAGMSVELNQEIVDDINECTTKIVEHKAKAKDYGGWVAVLTAQPKERQLDLHQDDWLFFFGK